MAASTIRDAEPERDAAACAAIYAPYVEAGADLLRGARARRGGDGGPDRAATRPPTPGWSPRTGARWSATPTPAAHRERAAYRWAVDVSVYVAADRRGEGLGRRLYEALFERLRAQRFQVACAGITLPNEASVALHERLGFAPVGVYRADRLEGRRLARRRLVAAGAGARRGEGPPPEPLPARRPARLPLPMPDEQHASRPPRRAREVLTEEDVFEALEEVIDPELGLDFVSLGLVYDVEIEKEDVYVTFTLTTPACPIGPQVSEQMKEFVGDLPGVSAVHPKMIFDPPWSPEMMTEDAKFALGF